MRANDTAFLGATMHGTVTAFRELIVRITVAAQCGPIPRGMLAGRARFLPLS
jgi:hypothetical protein